MRILGQHMRNGTENLKKNEISPIRTYCTSIDAEFQDESISVQCLCVLLRLLIII